MDLLVTEVASEEAALVIYELSCASYDAGGKLLGEGTITVAVYENDPDPIARASEIARWKLTPLLPLGARVVVTGAKLLSAALFKRPDHWR